MSNSRWNKRGREEPDEDDATNKRTNKKSLLERVLNSIKTDKKGNDEMEIDEGRTSSTAPLTSDSSYDSGYGSEGSSTELERQISDITDGMNTPPHLSLIHI